jgi:hypothetical protein
VVLIGSARVACHRGDGSGLAVLPLPLHVGRLDERRQCASAIAARVGSVAARVLMSSRSTGLISRMISVSCASVRSR